MAEIIKDMETKPEHLKPVLDEKPLVKKREEKKPFFNTDFNGMKDYVLEKVLKPAAKRVIADVANSMISMLLGGTPAASTQASRIQQPRVSYRSYYADPYESQPMQPPRRPSATRAYSADEIIYPSFAKAEEVKTCMEELIERFQLASIADLYDLSNLTCNYTDNKYGWKSLGNAHVEQVPDGWIIVLPPPQPL